MTLISTDLRNKIARAIIVPFEAAYKDANINYDPDDCYKAADEVIAVLLTELTGEKWEAKYPAHYIGPAELVRSE